MSGGLRSILFPEIGPADVQLPLTSQTLRLSVFALPSSLPAATDVNRKNDASSGFANPLPAPVAVQASAMLFACHAPSGDAHDTTGGVWSSQTSPTPS